MEILASAVILLIAALAAAATSRAKPKGDRPPKRPTTRRPEQPGNHLQAGRQTPRAGIRELRGKPWVIDGDTIVIQQTKIRLAGIDAPELEQPWGQKAKWEMVRICNGQIITARLNGEVSYDRLVATCHLPDGTDIGAEIVRRGLAIDLPHFSGGRYRHLEPPWARRRLEGLGFTQRSR